MKPSRPIPRRPDCPVDGCDNARNPDHVMCSRCWATVPKAMQTTIWRLYRSQRGTGAHLAAMTAATKHAAEQLQKR